MRAFAARADARHSLPPWAALRARAGALLLRSALPRSVLAARSAAPSGSGRLPDVSPSVGRSDGTLPRAYERVAVEASACSKGYSITLDGKTLRTPGRNALTLPNEVRTLARGATRGAEGTPGADGTG